jgi:hypothetical protein
MNLYNVNEERKALAIWQQNLNKSPTCQHALISSGRLAKHNIDIITLQEPAINFLNKTIASRDWILLYPTTHDKNPEKTHTVTLFRGDILTERWEQLDFPSGDVTVLCIKEDWGTMTLFNIYNDCEHNATIEVLTVYHRQHAQSIFGTEDTQQEHHLLWLRDFNRHHPYWDRPEDNRLFTKEAQDAAETLLKMVADLGMDMALAKGTPTHYHNVTKKWSRLDQVFITEHVFIMEHSMEAVTICNTLLEERGVNTDHVPIITVIDAELTKAPSQISRNFRDIDWEKFRALLEEKLDKIGPPKFIASQTSLNCTCKQLTTALQEAIEQEVPHTTIYARSKRWWSKELGLLRKETGKLSRKAYKLRSRPDHPVHEELIAKHWKYNKTIQFSKQHHWHDWLEKASDLDLWTAHKYISAPAGDGGKTRIPDLTVHNPGGEHTYSTNQDKGRALAKTFFLKKPQLENSAQTEEIAPTPVCKANPITKEQVWKHTARLKPFKAPGPDGIPNIVLIRCSDIIIERLWRIYSAIVERGLYYAPWKAFTMVVTFRLGSGRLMH